LGSVLDYGYVGHFRITPTLHTFSIQNYQATHTSNQNQAVGSAICFPASIRPFGKWYTYYFDKFLPTWVSFKGVFACSHVAIRRSPVSVWSDLLSQSGTHDNCEVGHYIEKIWYTILRFGARKKEGEPGCLNQGDAESDFSESSA
jgi:hypothetical protein